SRGANQKSGLTRSEEGRIQTRQVGRDFPAGAQDPGCSRVGSTSGPRVVAGLLGNASHISPPFEVRDHHRSSPVHVHYCILATVEISGTDSGSEVKSYLVRLLTYLPGRPIAEIPIGPQLLYEIGRLAAKLDKTLEKFHHPKLSSLHRENFIWNLKSVPLLEKYLFALGQNRNREIVEQVIQLFKDEVMTSLSHFRECINHGDLNDHNILIESRESAFGDAVYQVSGVLDFDDMSYGYYVFEAAITIMYMMIESKAPIQVGGHVLAGFESVVPLTPVERGALFLLVCSRFCQSLVLAAYSCQLYPENEEYLMITAKTGWKHLQQMFDMGRKAVEEIWFETAKSYESGISM
uniref:Hydroxylysine kinase n=1 Tax=Capra hircus TaxID=9925 RepID=A0A8C2P8C3_CAPHI